MVLYKHAVGSFVYVDRYIIVIAVPKYDKNKCILKLCTMYFNNGVKSIVMHTGKPSVVLFVFSYVFYSMLKKIIF